MNTYERKNIYGESINHIYEYMNKVDPIEDFYLILIVHYCMNNYRH